MVNHLSSIWPSAFASELGQIMRCLSCNCNLSDREANRKYDNWAEIKNPESRYIMLCDDCILDTDLNYEEDTSLSNDNYEGQYNEETETFSFEDR